MKQMASLKNLKANLKVTKVYQTKMNLRTNLLNQMKKKAKKLMKLCQLRKTSLTVNQVSRRIVTWASCMHQMPFWILHYVQSALDVMYCTYICMHTKNYRGESHWNQWCGHGIDLNDQSMNEYGRSVRYLRENIIFCCTEAQVNGIVIIERRIEPRWVQDSPATRAPCNYLF